MPGTITLGESPQPLTIRMMEGTTFDDYLTANDADNNPVPFDSTWRVVMAVKVKKTDPDDKIKIMVDSNAGGFVLTSGRITFNITPPMTTALHLTDDFAGYHDIKIIEPGGRTKTWAAGPFEVYKGITPTPVS